MRNIGICFLVFWVGLQLSACDGGSHHYAPVAEINTLDPIPQTGVHRVEEGETIYAVAWRYGLDYRSLTKINHLPFPYTLSEGQTLSLVSPQSKPVSSARQKILVHPNTQPLRPRLFTEDFAQLENDPMAMNQTWKWPTKAKVATSFSATNKGINIAGYLGEPIYASRAGKVVYCGKGLPSYGNLIILKHNDMYLSAYAYNNDIFVKEGALVRQGQKIASMGKSSSGKTMLHFEIRKAGKPLNPLSILPKT